MVHASPAVAYRRTSGSSPGIVPSSQLGAPISSRNSIQPPGRRHLARHGFRDRWQLHVVMKTEAQRYLLIRMGYDVANILQYDSHEAKVDEVDILPKRVLLAVVNQEIDVRRNP